MRSPTSPDRPTGRALLLAALLALGSTTAATAQCTQWSALGTGANNTVLALTAWPNGDVAAAGVFTQAGGSAANRVARWNGTAWAALGSGVDAPVRALTTLPNGDLVAAGDFATAGGNAASRIARWNGTTWSPLGTGISTGTPSGLYAVATMPNGDVIAGGYFTAAGGTPANAIARWNGSSWSALGSGIGATVFALAPLPNGELLVGGNFLSAGGVPAGCIARWNGSSWSALGTGLSGFRVNAITRLPNGDIVAGGAFTSAGGQSASNIARWNGSAWSPLGTGMNGDVLALLTLPNGDLLAGGQFTTAGGTAANGCARWNGSSWSALGFASGSQVYAATTRADGDRVVGGFFSSIGGVSTPRLARYTSTCPATAVDSAAGCASSGGANTFAATSLPWVGTTSQATGTGLPASALAVAVTGFTTTNQPVGTFLQPSPAHCTLWVNPDVAELLLPVAGTVTTTLTIPNEPTLVGLVLHRQLLVAEIVPSTQAFGEATASNRLTLTVGRF